MLNFRNDIPLVHSGKWCVQERTRNKATRFRSHWDKKQTVAVIWLTPGETPWDRGRNRLTCFQPQQLDRLAMPNKLLRKFPNGAANPQLP